MVNLTFEWYSHICTAGLSVDWWEVCESSLLNGAPYRLGLLLMIGGIGGVCEGGGSNGTIGWAAVGVGVWLVWICTA